MSAISSKNPPRVAILTAGGLAPCLCAAVAELVAAYQQCNANIEIIGYRDGYAGLLGGDKVVLSKMSQNDLETLRTHGGSPLGNSRVKLTNQDDCEKRQLVQPGEDPQAVAAKQLQKDKIDVLHTVGGDDTNGAAADLAQFLAKQSSHLTVVGLPKTVDNDVYPIAQSLGAATAAQQSARFFEHVVAEHSSNPRMLIVHEVMGRHCGWLTAAAARIYQHNLKQRPTVEAVGPSQKALSIHGIYIPEMPIDLAIEGPRLRALMDSLGCINIYISEGAGMHSIVGAMEAAGEEVPKDAFGHVKLDKINPGRWYADRFAQAIGAEKILVQKSGYFARAAPAGEWDKQLIQESAKVAVQAALAGQTGVVGLDDKNTPCIDPASTAPAGKPVLLSFDRIRGGKPFDIQEPWFASLLETIGQA